MYERVKIENEILLDQAKDEDEIYWIPATFTAPTKHTNQETDLIQKSTEV